jgi:hypothetical protein
MIIAAIDGKIGEALHAPGVDYNRNGIRNPPGEGI